MEKIPNTDVLAASGAALSGTENRVLYIVEDDIEFVKIMG